MTKPEVFSMKQHRRAFSVSVFVRHENAILLVMHKRLKKWLPIGGEWEPGEEPVQAAARELYEETGIEDFRFAKLPVHASGVEALPGLMLYEQHDAGDKGLHMNFAFLVHVRNRDVPKPCEEFTKTRWFNGNEPELFFEETVPNVGKLVRYALSVEGVWV